MKEIKDPCAKLKGVIMPNANEIVCELCWQLGGNKNIVKSNVNKKCKAFRKAMRQLAELEKEKCDKCNINVRSPRDKNGRIRNIGCRAGGIKCVL